MALQAIPRAAALHAQRQRAIAQAAVSSVSRLWRRVGTDFDEGYAAIEPQLVAVMDIAQEQVTVEAVEYVPAVLKDTGQVAAAKTPPRYTFESNVFVGVAGDGLPTESLAYGAVTTAKTAIGEGLTPRAALARGGRFLTLAVGTLMADTGRAAEGLASHATPVTGYVRMLSPPSCGRCVVLAGKHYRHNKGFARHPGCDCRHIPASENIAGDLTTDMAGYLSSLDDAGRARALGSYANARAYADGADPWQIVNAYRHSGMRTAQVYGHNVTYSLEGMTRRGSAYRTMSQVRPLSRMTLEGEKGYLGRVPNTPRLMPESIYQIAGNDRALADKMLHDYGWVL